MAGQNTGVLYHGASGNLLDWADVRPLFVNDGLWAALVLESAQYRMTGGWHHQLFGEYDAVGVTILSATEPADWTMATKPILDAGYAPRTDLRGQIAASPSSIWRAAWAADLASRKIAQRTPAAADPG